MNPKFEDTGCYKTGGMTIVSFGVFMNPNPEVVGYSCYTFTGIYDSATGTSGALMNPKPDETGGVIVSSSTY